MLTLAAAIGIGRFAFTPILPMMQKDAGLSLAAAGWLASANYAGYFIGALSAIWIRARSSAIVRASLVAIALLTAAMGATDHPLAWLALRALAGIASAWALVFGSAWVLQRLAAMGSHRLGGVVFGGVGLGAALAGGLCLVFLQLAWSSDLAWIAMGAAALLFTVTTWPAYAGARAPGTPGPAAVVPLGSGEHMRLICSYGCFGFGYIIPATFLPAMAREVISDPAIFGWAWPIFGAAAFMSALAAGWLSARLTYRTLWIAAHFILAFGVAVPVVWAGIGGIVLSALCVGSTFMVATMAGMQEARRVAPDNASSLMAAMTAAFAIGQILGPVLVSMVAGDPHGMDPTLIAASIVLILGALVLLPTKPALHV
ncbi:MAG TPA: YbfB/YjiJ family MFS transporter [Burkholderiales bacterium]|nr:YbfB/YjiJ family MFS transporter [Burkholderiales bacterium]